jgi:tRNA(Ile)-lysidine synthase
MQFRALLRRVSTFCRVHIPKGSSIGVAVSGGSDSTALLLVLFTLKKSMGIDRLVAMHVNHGLRGAESNGDERFVRDLAKNLGIPFYIKRLKGKSLTDKGMEAWARSERYRFFSMVKQREGLTCIATGHTMDDQAETVIHRIMRGAGLRGLRGILAHRQDGVVRPLLTCSRVELAEWLEDQGIAWRTDSSNSLLDYERNRIRHQILPLLESREHGAALHCAAIAAAAQTAWTMLQPGIDRWISAYAALSDNRFSIDKQGLSDELHGPEALLTLFERYNIDAYSRHIESLIQNSSRHSGTFLLPGGEWQYHPMRSRLEFSKKTETPPLPFNLPLSIPGISESKHQCFRFEIQEISPALHDLPTDNLTVFLDRDACGSELRFRAMRSDDRFTPLGKNTSVLVKEFCAKQGMPAQERKRCGVVTGKGGRIVWIPGLRISNHARISATTRRALKISYQSCPRVV